MRAKSIKGRSIEEIQLALEQSRADGSTLALVFISVKRRWRAFLHMVNMEGRPTANRNFIPLLVAGWY